MLKCFGCIRFLGFFKILIGFSLVAVGIWMSSTDTADVVDCNGMDVACPPAFEQLIIDLNGGSTLSQDQDEIQAYCGCLTGCMNYFLVYEEKQNSTDVDNCFALSSKLVPTERRRLGHSDGPRRPRAATETAAAMLYSALDSAWERSPAAGRAGSMPGVAQRQLSEEPDMAKGDVCITCQEAAEAGIFESIGGVAFISGIAVLVLAACELMELKWHARCYAFCVLLTDVVVATILVVGVCVAIWGMLITHGVCVPETVDQIVEKAGEDSTNGNPDHAAAYAQFIRTLLEPSFDGLCELAPKFTVAFMTLALGTAFSLMSFAVSMCVCCGCTDDGKSSDPQDRQAAHFQAMMGNNDYMQAPFRGY